MNPIARPEPRPSDALIDVQALNKQFTLHQQGGQLIQALEGINLQVSPGECVALQGASGSGKSTLLRSLYANYLVEGGHVRIRGAADAPFLDLSQAQPREILQARRQIIGYVSQFLRVIPRVSAEQVVAEPLQARGISEADSLKRARKMLERLNLPATLWTLAPGTFSGGEQQRVNIARGFIVDYPILLLDEPTASLDARNREVVLELMKEAKQRGSALLGIFHDEATRDAIADRVVEIRQGRIV